MEKGHVEQATEYHTQGKFYCRTRVKPLSDTEQAYDFDSGKTKGPDILCNHW